MVEITDVCVQMLRSTKNKYKASLKICSSTVRKYFVTPLKLKMSMCRPQSVWPLTPDITEVSFFTQLPGLRNQEQPHFHIRGLAPFFLLVFFASFRVLRVSLNCVVSFDLCNFVYLFWQIRVLTFSCLRRLSARLLWYLPISWKYYSGEPAVAVLFPFGTNNLFIILKIILQPYLSFLTTFRFIVLIENAIMDEIWYEMTNYGVEWSMGEGNPIISSIPIIMLNSVPFCITVCLKKIQLQYILIG